MLLEDAVIEVSYCSDIRFGGVLTQGFQHQTARGSRAT